MEQKARRFPGIHCVLYALYDAEERLDRAAMAAQVERMIALGVDGVTVLGLATEVAKLTGEERRQVIDWAAEDVAGRVPLSVTVAGNSVAAQVALARHAEAAGADWLILQPPVAGSYAAAEYLDFFARVGAGIGLPWAVQNAPAYLGRGLSAADLAALRARAPGLTHLKAESPAMEIAQLIAVAGADMTVLNGRGGFEFTDNLRAGCAGFVLAPDVIDHAVRMQRLWRAGEQEEAELVYRSVLPAIGFVMQSIEHLICYGKRLYGLRSGQAIHDRAPALRPTAEGLAALERHAAALGGYPDGTAG
jgi:4-hydroxy-tetrahydrodipicolinate synthase